jgi:hypothetical protein
MAAIHARLFTIKYSHSPRRYGTPRRPPTDKRGVGGAAQEAKGDAQQAKGEAKDVAKKVVDKT